MAFQSPAPFSFGTSSAAAAFGVSPPAFGQSAPAFGSSFPTFGSSAPAFGSAAPALGASTPAFGAATPAFGSSFSAAAPSTLFGASSPAFGSTAGSFPFCSSATPSLFGSSSQGFQASGPAPLFSFNSAASPASGQLFSFPNSQPAPSPGQPQLPFGNQNAHMATIGVPAQPNLDAIRELEALRNAFQYAPGNHKFRFQHLFLNVVEHPAARVRPQDVDDLQFREALQAAGGAANKAKLWPVAANGFQDLVSRKQQQDKANDEHKHRLEQALQAAQHLLRRQDVLVHDQLSQVQRRHQDLCHRMLRVMRSVDALEGRFADAMGHHPAEIAAAQARLAQQLTQLEGSTAASAQGGLKRRVDAVAAAAHMQAQAPAIAAGIQSSEQIDNASYEQLFSSLEQHAKALKQLLLIAHCCNRDISIISQQPGQTAQPLH